MKTHVVYRPKLASRREFPESTLLVYDQDLLKISKSFKRWAGTFSAQLPLSAGEKTKSLERFPEIIKKVLKKTEIFSSREMTILVVGGGTLTDLGGFLASVLKRGVRLILVPTTWLAAMDSAHGGKNGLNFSGYKNQIGTFYFPERIEIIKEILFCQPPTRAREAYGELVKMSLISKSKLFSDLQKHHKIDNKKIFSSLPLAIEAKYKVVQQDPFESKKLRHVLNLGHTFAHAMEKCFKISHGDAVFYGVAFSLVWSRWKKVISEREFDVIIEATFWRQSFRSESYARLLSAPVSEVKKSLFQDKKRSSRGYLLEPFVQARGQVVLKNITTDEFLAEFQRQKKLLQKVTYASKN